MKTTVTQTTCPTHLVSLRADGWCSFCGHRPTDLGTCDHRGLPVPNGGTR
jgi:hypothetical protein